MTGQRFGRLTVVNRAEDAVRASGKHYVQWLCKCDCGNYTIVSPSNLHSGRTKSCGCLKKDKRGAKHWRFDDLTGMKFGKLTVLYQVENKGEKIAWQCRCECGNEAIIVGADLKSGHTKSCGCDQYGHSIKHGGSNSRLYGVWAGMIQRCTNPNTSVYKYYGGRGIKICDTWMSFESFQYWALTNGYNPDAEYGECTLDRIDVNGNYEPDNCRWVDIQTQANNRRPTPSSKKPFAKKVIRLDDMKIYGSIKEAGDDVGIHYAGVSAVCRGIQKTAGGYRWGFYRKEL